jgi:transcriptional regulator with XRE-family HTH domain
MGFADKVRRAREQLKISQETLGRALNVSFATINRWENGKAAPHRMTRDVFYSFCKKNGVIVEEDEKLK